MTAPGASRRRTGEALAALVVLLVAANVVRSTLIPDGAHLPFNLAIGGGALLIARSALLSRDELGLARRNVPAGLRLGLLVALVVTAAVTVAAFVSSFEDAFDDSRVDTGIGGLLLNVLVEELAFRGVLHALLTRLTSTARAIALGAMLFGLWHVFPAWRADTGNAALEEIGRWPTVVGTFAATTAVGVLFGILRARSGSLVAPIVAHLSTNVVPFVAAWLLAR